MTAIYLDYQATTPLDPRVAAMMRPFLDGGYGNPHSSDHSFGRDAAMVVDTARQKIALAIGARSSEVLFTSGATEANNTALKGILPEAQGHRIVVATEHACVLAAAQSMASCTVLSVKPDGLIDPDQVHNAIRSDTGLVSVMLVNNEIGVIQPIARIAKICRDAGVLLHCDAAQALGRVSVQVQELGVDLLSLSGHKIYGPKGIGALFVRRGVDLKPLLDGGGQERGMRSGTLSPMLCAGFAQAAEIADQEHATDQARAAKLIAQLLAGLDAQGVNYRINGSQEQRIADNLNLHFPNVDQVDFMRALGDLAVSSASACSGGAGKTSHVLRALGHDPAQKAANIRLCVGRNTTAQEITVAIARIVASRS